MRVSGENMAKIKIPIPTLALQEKIVSILDRFESLVNDLTAGLPAEIEARRQQYEYYRNQLLTFKRLA
jgi:type I restriction enzyme S subunit